MFTRMIDLYSTSKEKYSRNTRKNNEYVIPKQYGVNFPIKYFVEFSHNFFQNKIVTIKAKILHFMVIL